MYLYFRRNPFNVLCIEHHMISAAQSIILRIFSIVILIPWHNLVRVFIIRLPELNHLCPGTFLQVPSLLLYLLECSPPHIIAALLDCSKRKVEPVNSAIDCV